MANQYNMYVFYYDFFTIQIKLFFLFFISFHFKTDSPILSLIMGSDSHSQDIVEGNNVYFECDIKVNPPQKILLSLFRKKAIEFLFLSSSSIVKSNIKEILFFWPKGIWNKFISVDRP